jgi:hypothetical protein
VLTGIGVGAHLVSHVARSAAKSYSKESTPPAGGEAERK